MEVKLYVGNLSYSTTEDDLRTVFAVYGKVQTVSIINDRDTGRPRGFAFVEMPNDDEASKAVAALDGKSVGGRNIKVNEARPKGESTGPKFGGSKFGGQGGNRNGGNGAGRGKGRGGFSYEDYSEAARQPREPRW